MTGWEFGISDTAALPGTGLLVRLRAETRAEHDAIEQALDLMDTGITLESYRHRIRQFYGFYRPLEEQLLKRRAWLDPWLDLDERWKLPLLSHDLHALGPSSPSALALCDELPLLGGPPECFGCLYVLEGSTLGGQVISRHVRQALGITPEAGGLFFDGYGARTGAMWQQFRSAATGFAGTPDCTADAHDRVVTAARQTFETLRMWCEPDRAG